jgi:hypothetical protein
MQLTNSEKPTEVFWWPHPDAIQDLVVEEAEHGFDLSAPDDTECGDWLNYWNQSPERLQTFNDAFIEALKSQLDSLEKQNGENEVLQHGGQSDREQAQDVSPGPLA